MAKSKQENLPGMEDRTIKALEEKALEYADVRDQRMELSTSEHALKSELLVLMKNAKKTKYVRDGIEVSLVVEHETVKVRVKKEKQPEESEAE